MSKNILNKYILLFISIEGKDASTEWRFFTSLAENYDQILFTEIDNIGKTDNEISDTSKQTLDVILKSIKRKQAIQKVKLFVSCDGDIFVGHEGKKKAFENTFEKLKEYVQTNIRPKELEAYFKYDYGSNIETFLWMCSEYFDEKLFLDNYEDLTKIKDIVNESIKRMYGNVSNIKTFGNKNKLWTYFYKFYDCDNAQDVVKKIYEKFKDKKVDNKPYSVYFEFIEQCIDIYKKTDYTYRKIKNKIN